MFTQPHQTHANTRLHLGLAQLPQILSTLLVFRQGYANTGKIPLLLKYKIAIFLGDNPTI